MAFLKNIAMYLLHIISINCTLHVLTYIQLICYQRNKLSDDKYVYFSIIMFRKESHVALNFVMISYFIVNLQSSEQIW